MAKPPPTKDVIATAIRPLLARVSTLAAEQGRQPGDFFVLIEKYEPSNVTLLPRTAEANALALAKTDARRQRYARLLAAPCKPSELLVLVGAGDHVEARRFAIPVRLASAVGSPELTKADFEAYVRFHIRDVADKILDKGGRLEDHVVILRPPSGVPTTVARADAKPVLAEFGERALAMLEVPAQENELLCAFWINGQPDCARITLGFARADEDTSRADEFQRLMDLWIQVAYDTVVEMGEKPSDHCAYVRWPAPDGGVPKPEIMPRKVARDRLRASPKYKQIREHLDQTQCDDVLLLCDVQGAPDIAVMWRDKEKIPRFRMTSLVSKEMASTTDIASLARPYLKRSIERAASEGRRPCDYFLLVAKFETEKATLLPRDEAAGLVALAKTPIQRQKLTALLNRSCGDQELLVLVTVNDDVEGAFVPLPTVVPDPEKPSKFGISPTELKQIEAYFADHGPAMANVVDGEGGRLADYVGIARLPNLAPIVLRRSVAKEAIAHARLGEVTRELDVPATNDHELLVFYKIAGHGSFSRLQFAPGQG